MNIWHTLLYQPLVNLLILFYQLLGHNLGLAIIFLTIAIRAVLYPLTKPSLEAAEKMKNIAPEITKLKEKHKDNKQALMQAQMELYKQHGVNPGAGCLPQIVQIVILIALFQAFTQVLATNGDSLHKLNEILYNGLKIKENISSQFLYLNLNQPDLIKLSFSFNFFGFKIDKLPGLFLLASAITQFLSSKLMMPQVKKMEKEAKKTPQQEDDISSMMQKQMLYMMPLMTIIIGFRFPSGLVLYWFTFSAIMLLQQILVKSKKITNG